MIFHGIEQNTIEWRNLRLGIPTASGFSNIVTPKGEQSKSISNYACQLAGDLYAGIELDSWQGNQYTRRGHEVEPEAVDYYEFNYEKTDPGGFFTDDKNRYGCSPDRLVGKDGLLEIKCLPKEHLKSLIYYINHDRIPGTYIPQTQGQLFVTGRKWCDLLFYHEFLPKFVIRQYPDLNMFAKIAKQITECITLRDEIVQQIKDFE